MNEAVKRSFALALWATIAAVASILLDGCNPITTPVNVPGTVHQNFHVCTVNDGGMEIGERCSIDVWIDTRSRQRSTGVESGPVDVSPETTVGIDP